MNRTQAAAVSRIVADKSIKHAPGTNVMHATAGKGVVVEQYGRYAFVQFVGGAFTCANSELTNIPQHARRGTKARLTMKPREHVGIDARVTERLHSWVSAKRRGIDIKLHRKARSAGVTGRVHAMVAFR